MIRISNFSPLTQYAASPESTLWREFGADDSSPPESGAVDSGVDSGVDAAADKSATARQGQPAQTSSVSSPLDALDVSLVVSGGQLPQIRASRGLRDMKGKQAIEDLPIPGEERWWSVVDGLGVDTAAELWASEAEATVRALDAIRTHLPTVDAIAALEHVARRWQGRIALIPATAVISQAEEWMSRAT